MGRPAEPIPRNVLEDLYVKRGLGMVAVAKRVRRSLQTVARYLHSYGIEVRPRALRKVKHLSDRTLVERLRAVGTLKDLAAELDVHPSYLSRELKRRAIAVRRAPRR